jgi:hypothetical protein
VIKFLMFYFFFLSPRIFLVMGYIHKIRSWGCTLSKDFGDCLFWKIINMHLEYFVHKLQKVIRKSFWFKNMLHYTLMWICVLKVFSK